MDLEAPDQLAAECAGTQAVAEEHEAAELGDPVASNHEAAELAESGSLVHRLLMACAERADNMAGAVSSRGRDDLGLEDAVEKLTALGVDFNSGKPDLQFELRQLFEHRPAEALVARMQLVLGRARYPTHYFRHALTCERFKAGLIS